MKKIKRGLLITGIVLILLLITDVITGNYLVSYALQRKDATYEMKITYDSEEEKQQAENVYYSWEKEAEEGQQWLDSVDASNEKIVSSDGLVLEATMIDHNTEEIGGKWVVLLHGYSSDRSSMLPYAKEYYDRGYNILMPDLRSHGESEGEYIGMGWLDKDDVLLWLGKIKKQDTYCEIVLHGVSMGAATVMMTAGEPNLQYNVVAAIEDCGYTSVWEVFKIQLKAQFDLPAFPLLNTADIIASLRAGYDFKEASALRQIRRCKIPMLFIHGEDDDFVPFEMVYELYNAAICQKELLTVPGAGHAASEVTDPKLYWSSVFSFLETYGEQ